VVARHHLLAHTCRLELVPHHATSDPKVSDGVVVRGRRVAVLDAPPHLSAEHVAFGQRLQRVEQHAHKRQTRAQSVGDAAAAGPGLAPLGVVHLPVHDAEDGRVGERVDVDRDRPVELVRLGQIVAARQAVQELPPLLALAVHRRPQVPGVDFVPEVRREHAQGVVERDPPRLVERGLQPFPPHVVDADRAMRRGLVFRVHVLSPPCVAGRGPATRGRRLFKRCCWAEERCTIKKKGVRAVVRAAKSAAVHLTRQ
jgi:hypothetical protein